MSFFKRIPLLVCLLWFGVSCINTSYSRKDELSISSREMDLILGQFAHHGDAFYAAEVKRTKAVLEKAPKDFVARNDLASAYIKLKQYAVAEAEFKHNELLHPNRYETAANLGVLYKKMKRFDDAAVSIARSLEIKPEGHMGLGDYYLRMIQWLGQRDEQVKLAWSEQVNFLGVEYDEGPLRVAQSPVVKKEYLLTLIKNDYAFPDVYSVLGDVYFAEKNYQYALRCYFRAERIGTAYKVGNVSIYRERQD